MGAIARQVPQVKRKNSTNCNFPEARLTVRGSVASRLGPREVATGNGVGSTASVGAATTSVAGITASVGDSGSGVALGSTTTGGTGWGGDSVVAAAGAHEANKRANRLRLVLSAVEGVGMRRLVIKVLGIIKSFTNLGIKIFCNINSLPNH